MTTGDWLKQAEASLKAVDITTARLDSLVLLEDVTGRARAWLLAHPDTQLTESQSKKLRKLLNLRVGHLPLAYVRGKTEFYGREFLITPAVLEPRPESETMIEELLQLPDLPNKLRIADVGTGSGALGITAKLELPSAEIDLIDIDTKALKVAQNNVDLFTLSLRLIRSDLLATTGSSYDLLLCNLPYVPDGFQINKAAMREPRLAIFGGSDGLDVYRKLFQQLANRRYKPLYILSESLPPQHDQLAEIARTASYQTSRQNDFIQLFRWVQK